MRVDWRTSASLVGGVLKTLAIPLGFTLAVAAYYGDPLAPFGVAVALSLALGFGLERLERGELGNREAFLMVSVAWLAVALVGAVPFVLAGEGSLAHPVNALFESMSGITTTGATAIESFDDHSRSVLMWRQVIQWLGGLGILVLAVAVLSQLSVAGAQLMETETQTRDVTKLSPRIEDTARMLGGIYVGLTALMTLTLVALNVVGLAPNMSPYNALAHAFTAIATAGFSPEALSLGAFSPAVQWATIPFMFVGATNFVILYFLLHGDPSRLRDSEEFRFYLGMVVAMSAVLAAFLWLDGQYATGEQTIRHALFQVVSIVTTTGFATVDFDAWSVPAKHVLLFAMFLGGMAGSTTCSIKTLRWLVVLKTLRRDLFRTVHPDAVRPIRLTGDVVGEEAVQDIQLYVLLSLLFFAGTTAFVVADAARVGLPMGELEAMSAAAATFLNIGPGFGAAGPYGSYAEFPATTKAAMILLMWVGRIEIIPVLVVLTPTFWRS